MSVIEFEDVRHRMPNGVVALDSVSLKVGRGEVVAVVGGNGAGKTTLLKHMNGLLKPSSGRVTVFGKETKEESIARLSRRVGLVFQNSDHQIFSESAKEEVMFGLKNFGIPPGEAEEKAGRALEYYGLADLAARPPLTLSGGEKKRLCIAAVMAWEPDVLVLDEPTVGQDYPSRSRLFGVVQGLASSNRTVVIVSHDLEFLWPLSPRTVVMSKGRVVADGPAREVFMRTEMLRDAGLREPQLLQLSRRFGREEPFTAVDQAAAWLTERGRAN
ncbi:MAG: ABC transporter ATP-binding protein [Nitrososphaerota archaeon]|nr:ABC transporter ATP-binding protein [Nitrososphaerota archaeon]MDG6939567.1 ABC transporter ATP-binding protein [Nitrososphaerota archaeon]